MHIYTSEQEIMLYELTFDPVTLTFETLTVDICRVECAVLWSNSIQNLSKIEQSAAEFMPFQYST